MKSPIIVALDMESERALELAKKLNPQECKVKVGSQLFTADGPIIIEKLNELGFDIFLDLKFHDIPNTVKKAVEVAIKMGVWMLNVHSLGGKEMLRAAYEVVEKVSIKPLLVGVTVLTSLNDKSLKEVGLGLNTEDQVLLLAELCQTEGLNGVVCSANELSVLRKHLEEDFLLVTPGIRSSGQESDDQKRISTASEAISNGADYIVIGREISNEIDPSEKIRQILETV
ncbi:MAG TPA: orotidine-5'-phosphate decarboxylase [Gammaproteobacteria bacterium]|jgi:orotidine-5'-phosphate decarboxylase|nr:orotidine-5'-phosphate decarboxylase [Gammaproteobacteria bacterium]